MKGSEATDLLSLLQVSVEQSRSTTPQSGGWSGRKFSRCLNIAVTLSHPTLMMTSSSPPTFGIPSSRGRCCQQPPTAPSMCGIGSINQLVADQSKDGERKPGLSADCASVAIFYSKMNVELEKIWKIKQGFSDKRSELTGVCWCCCGEV